MNGVFVFVPIMGMGIAVAAIISSVMLKLQRMKLEEAKLAAGNSDETAALARQVAELRDELTDVHERLDFTERLLTQVKDAPVLPPPPRES